MLARIGYTTSATFVKEEKIAPASRKKKFLNPLVPSDAKSGEQKIPKISGFSSHPGLYKHLSFRPF